MSWSLKSKNRLRILWKKAKSLNKAWHQKKNRETGCVSSNDFLGKGVTVPDFSTILPDDAQAAVEGVTVRMRMQFTQSLPYGQLISQSETAGTVLTSKDDQGIEVVYSAGQPYIKDYRRSEILEGDLQKLFFDEFRSKGANISYQVRYVNSAEPYGTIVGMSKFNQFLPLEDTITFDISLGNQTAPAHLILNSRFSF